MCRYKGCLRIRTLQSLSYLLELQSGAMPKQRQPNKRQLKDAAKNPASWMRSGWGPPLQVWSVGPRDLNARCVFVLIKMILLFSLYKCILNTSCRGFIKEVRCLGCGIQMHRNNFSSILGHEGKCVAFKVRLRMTSPIC